MSRVHGGPDAQGPARWDFSANANACGPCPVVLQALRAADPSRYPDPAYGRLRRTLAAWHGVAPKRIVFAASASEFIVRITAVSARLAPGAVAVPAHAYGDYAAAARANARPVGHDARTATLAWCCEPSSPLGADAPTEQPPGCDLTVLDLAYAPLRLHGRSAWPAATLDRVFQLHTPNKALGVTGVRGAYAIAPRAAGHWVRALEDAAPSWPLGAHAVAMLEAWPRDGVQQWLARSLDTLRGWHASQLALFGELGCEPAPAVANFFCARWPGDLPLAALRARGIALRDCASFGLPGWVRASVQPPAAQHALRHAAVALRGTRAFAEAGPR